MTQGRMYGNAGAFGRPADDCEYAGPQGFPLYVTADSAPGSVFLVVGWGVDSHAAMWPLLVPLGTPTGGTYATDDTRLTYHLTDPRVRAGRVNGAEVRP